MPWQDDIIPADLTVEAADGKQVAAREHPFFKEATDIPAFLKKAFAEHREVGARIPLRIEKERAADGTYVPKAESIAKWQTDHLPKLYENGILMKPPADAKEYAIIKPDDKDMPAGITWKQEHADAFGALGVKHGVSKAAMNDFLELHRKAVVGTSIDIQTDYDTTMLALKKEFGDKFDERMESSKRLTKLIFQSPEELRLIEETGIGNHPRFLGIIARLSAYVENDNTLKADLANVGSGAGGQVTGDDARAELAKIMTDKTHPMYEGYRRNDPKVSEHIDNLYKRAHGTTAVTIGSSVDGR